MRLRVSPWQARLLQDSILPTLPTRVGEDDAVDALRERLFRERKLQIPPTLKSPATRCGFVIELPAKAARGESPRWRNVTGTQPAGTIVRGTRAEFSWPGDATNGVDCTLLATDGRELARVVGDPRTGVTLFLASGMHGWPWIGLERAPDDDADVTSAQWTARLEWQLPHGAPVPASWRRDDRWSAGRGHRLDLIANELWTGQAKRTLTLIDRVTGWAIESEIEQTQEFPEDKTP